MDTNVKPTTEGLKCDFCGSPLPPTKRSWKRYCNPKCKMAAYDRDHPRQKIGVLTEIVIGHTRYTLTNPRPAEGSNNGT